MFKLKYLVLLGLVIACIMPFFSTNGVLPSISKAQAAPRIDVNAPISGNDASSLGDGSSKARKRFRMSRRDARTVKEIYVRKYGERPKAS